MCVCVFCRLIFFFQQLGSRSYKMWPCQNYVYSCSNGPHCGATGQKALRHIKGRIQVFHVGITAHAFGQSCLKSLHAVVLGCKHRTVEVVAWRPKRAQERSSNPRKGEGVSDAVWQSYKPFVWSILTPKGTIAAVLCATFTRGFITITFARFCVGSVL